MRVIAGIFAVSVIAIVAVIPVRAEVVSTELLDKRLGTEGTLATVASSGSYDDLTNKPTIPAAQVQPNWNATSGMGQILNKPTLGTLAAKNAVTSAEITDGTIVNADISATAAIAKSKLDAAVQASLGKADTALQAHQDISGKENISNKATVTYTSGSTTQYPSIAIAETIAGKAVEGVSRGLGALAGLDTVGTDEIDNASVTKAKLDTAVQASLGKADTALQAHQDISGKENISNKTITIAAAASASDSKYPTEKAVATALAGKQNTLSAAQLNAANSGVTAAKVTTYDGYAAQIAAKATSTDITNAINALDVAASTEAGNVVTNVSQTDGKISVTRGTITVPTVNNATLTITQGGVTKGTFTANQATAATIELTDNDTKYTASGSNGVTASVSGTVVNVAGTAATRDAVGVAKLGVIPVGTTGTATATIWVE